MKKFKKGDTVVVTTGADRGKSGEITRLLPNEMRVVVSGVNVRTKHVKPRGTDQPGGLEKAERPIDISNIALVHPNDKKKTSRVGFDYKKDGTKVRVYRQASNKEVK